MKEDICKKIVEVVRKSDRVMGMVLVFDKEVIRVIYGMLPRLEDQGARKINSIMSGICKTLVKYLFLCHNG